MSRHRHLPALAGVVCFLMMASISSLSTATAQEAPDDPFADVDLESLKEKGGATGVAPTDEQPTPEKPLETIFDNGNSDAVLNRPTRPTVFVLDGPTRIAKITTYHWNDGRGAPAGTIALKSASGETYGPWQTTGEPGQGGVPNAYWVANPDVSLPPGSYTVIDSGPATWARNNASKGAGITVVGGYVE
jgi:hypothetical protein